MLRYGLLVGLMGGVASTASAQVVYQPVQYQYHTGQSSQTYYYGGTNPIQQALATLPPVVSEGNIVVRPLTLPYRGEIQSFADRRDPVYSDRLPYVNVRPLGFTISDAQNESNRNLPTFFRKSDLLARAQLQADGTYSVPAVQGPTPTSPVIALTKPRPEGPKGVILIIPKPPKAPEATKTLHATAR